MESLPKTATNKIVVRTLAREAWETPDPVYVRDGDRYRPLTGQDRASLAEEFLRHGRSLLR
jgi:hypothetical protein